MKKILCIAAVFALLTGSVFAQQSSTTTRGGTKSTTPATTTTTAVKAAKPTGKTIKGSVVSVMNYCAGKGAVLTKEQASDMANRGEMLGVVVGNAKSGKLHLVCNADGTNAGKKLANGGTVSITGKLMSKGGVNLITAEQVQ